MSLIKIYFAGSDRRIVDYLGAEVLDQQPGEVLTFLLPYLGAGATLRVAV